MMPGSDEAYSSWDGRRGSYAKFFEESKRAGRPEYARLVEQFQTLEKQWTVDAERAFCAELKRVVQDDESSSVGWAWRILDSNKAAAEKAFVDTVGRKPARGDRYFHLFFSPKSDRLVETCEELTDLLPAQADTAAMYLLSQLVVARTALLKEVIEFCYYASSRPPPGHTKASWAAERERFVYGQSSHIRQWLNLGWVNGILVPIGDLRHAIAHGDVRIFADAIEVYSPERDDLIATLSWDEINIYAESAAAVWTAFCLEMLLEIARSADAQGDLTLDLGTVDGGFSEPMHPYRPPPPPGRTWNLDGSFGTGAPQFLSAPVPIGGADPEVWEDAKRMMVSVIQASEEFSESAWMLAGLAGYDRGGKGSVRENQLLLMVQDAQYRMREHIADPGPIPRSLLKASAQAAGWAAELLSITIDGLTLDTPDPRSTRQSRRREKRKRRD